MSVLKCKGCVDRFVGCHATCKEYQEYRKEKDKAIELRRLTVDVTNYANDRGVRLNQSVAYGKRVKMGLYK